MGFYSSITQVVIVGFLAFAGPGLFNALNGLGAAGSGDPAVAATANGTLYGFFAVVGYFSGIFFNIFGPRLCLFFGGLTYAIYAICMYYSSNGVWIAAVGGSILGIGAGVFWTAQAALMLAYATDHEKGKFTGIFWAIFNLGAMTGGFLQMGLNWSFFTAVEGGVYTVKGAIASPIAYWTFIALMLAGSATSLILLAPVKKVVKSDGTHPEFTAKAATAMEEFKAAAGAIKDPFVWKMFFYFFYSNWYYTFEFGAMNGFFFNARAAGLNSALYRLMNILGAQVLGLIGDNHKWNLMKRARLTFFSNVFLFCLTWILAFVNIYTQANGKVDKELSTYDPSDAAEFAPVYKMYKQDATTGVWAVDADAGETGESLINRLAWFPPNQISLSDGSVVEDGCQWLKETRVYYRTQQPILEVIEAGGDIEAQRLACLNMNDSTYSIEQLNAKCIWDLYQCVDLESTDQFGRGMMDIVQDSEAPLCDLYQTDICMHFNAEFLSNEILPIITQIVMGMSDAFFQTYVFWMIGVKAGSSVQLSVKYAACYKGIQSLGASISWLSDLSPSFLYRYQAIVNIILGSASLAGSYFAIKDLQEPTKVDYEANEGALASKESKEIEA